MYKCLAHSLLVLAAASVSTYAAPQNIAIIGGGASGTSAAYWIQKEMQSVAEPPKITLYEKNNRLGGRVYSMPIPGLNMFVEAGASIFVDVNQNMMQFADQFGLSKADSDTAGLSNPAMGVWNGTSFTYIRTGNNTIDNAEAVSRFGLYTMGQLNTFLQGYLQPFMGIYGISSIYESVQGLLSTLGLSSSTTQTGRESMNAIANLNEDYLANVVEIGCRVNYGQGLEELHSMGMAISMITSAAKIYQIGTGNQRIFEKLAQASEATIKLNTAVTTITKITGVGGGVQYTVATSGSSAVATFDAVVMASPPNTYTDAPIVWNNINANSYFKTLAPVVDYKTVHVTFVVGRVNPSAFFNMPFPSMGLLPISIYTPQSAVSRVPFTSLSINRVLTTSETFDICSAISGTPSDVDPYAIHTVTKLFSPTALTNAQLNQFYSFRLWTYKTSFQAYPELVSRAPEDFPPFTVDENLYFPNAFEPFVSTMETSIVSSKNIAKLVARDLAA
ncbi:hypothetical protein H4R33_001600 [Dimargaris cristalligena]|uniref:Prenylcysteine lyase-domain-containing protein n=1 Tax=Dimargaris cristalligena TaxID=215637 RepID=A0A4P9ZXQ4_9FUNG|nr:hypothetical protein H4R33_001600 [Dimargaris cristalligena]RKP37692.1 Prenylcysteine lyase-domain-containing protein [Dimargaris cristalligena]|eukprot:RKP37692.1 Prenylcysteine lyase-domain-containing protein [Dimargaris cristalligena]